MSKTNLLRKFIDEQMNEDYSSLSRQSKEVNKKVGDDADQISEEDEEEEKLIAVSKEFQENVIKFVTLDNLTRRKDLEAKEIKQQRKPCEDFVLKYLSTLEENAVDITGGHLRVNKSEQKMPVTKDMIKDAIKKKVANPEVVEAILKDIEESRPKKTRVNLKRTYNRGKRVVPSVNSVKK
jgi:hypothetical protein